MTQDPGLQAQRTALAWRRTALTALVCALLAARSGFQQYESWLLVLSALLVMATLLLALCAVWRARALLHQSAMPQCIAAHWMRSAAIAATLCCLVAVFVLIGV